MVRRQYNSNIKFLNKIAKLKSSLTAYRCSIRLFLSRSMSNLLMHLDKLLKHGQILSSNLDGVTHILKFHISASSFTVILHSHVVHDDTDCYHLLQALWIPYFCRSSNNYKAGLEHSKCPLNTISSSLFLAKVSYFLTNWLRDVLDD